MAAEFADVHDRVANVEQRLIDLFAELYPHWHTEDGACPNCVDLYRAYRETFTHPVCLGHGPPSSEEEVIPCPLCGHAIIQEHLLFHRRVDELLLERIGHHNPSWVRDDGECPRCVTYLAKTVAAAGEESAASSWEAA